jgi:brefeldin A-resistance guanine nucleotide exchange factor 1
MHDVVRTVFARLFELDPTTEEPKLQSNLDEDGSELKVSVGVTAAVPSVSGDTPTESEMHVDPSVDQRAAPPSSATLERTECMSLVQLGQSMCSFS